jgi:hypothetical protein
MDVVKSFTRQTVNIRIESQDGPHGRSITILPPNNMASVARSWKGTCGERIDAMKTVQVGVGETLKTVPYDEYEKVLGEMGAWRAPEADYQAPPVAVPEGLPYTLNVATRLHEATWRLSPEQFNKLTTSSPLAGALNGVLELGTKVEAGKNQWMGIRHTTPGKPGTQFQAPGTSDPLAWAKEHVAPS